MKYDDLRDLNGYVPGLNIAKSEGAERIITIRGIGYETAQSPNSQPGVAFRRERRLGGRR